MSSSMFGPYQIIRLLGEGGFSTVYEAFDHELRKVVALKLLPQDANFSATARQRFAREIEVARRLQHRRIVKVYRAGFLDDRGFISMKLMPGGTLDHWQRRGQLDPASIVRVIQHIAEALQYAHQGEVLHRDVKPSNILLDQQGHAYLCDFGLTKVRGMVTVTRHADVIGTVHYKIGRASCRERV